MSLFFAYVLSVCPAINDIICVLITIFCVCFFLCILALANEPEESDAYKEARKGALFAIKVLFLLALLWALVPSQKRLDAMMLNYHATYTACNEMGICLGDK